MNNAFVFRSSFSDFISTGKFPFVILILIDFSNVAFYCLLIIINLLHVCIMLFNIRGVKDINVVIQKLSVLVFKMLERRSEYMLIQL